MNKPTHKPEPQDIIKSLEHVHPSADETFQNLLETRLIEEWYRQTPTTKQKRNRQYAMPLTFVASLILIVLAGVLIISLRYGSQAGYLAPQALPLSTPLPTLQPSPSSDDLPLILDAGMVAVGVPIDLKFNDDTFVAGDVVDILANLNREQLATIPEFVYSEFADLLDSYQTDSLNIRISGDIKILKVENQNSLMVFQVSPQDAVVLTWLIETQIPITLSRQ